MATPDAVAPRPDGRTLRAERTRQAIIDAHMALLLDGDVAPTGPRIAEKAGVSLRALSYHFNELEALFAAAGAKMVEIQYADYRPVPVELPLGERIERFCRQRAGMLEAVAGVCRARLTCSCRENGSRTWAARDAPAMASNMPTRCRISALCASMIVCLVRRERRVRPPVRRSTGPAAASSTRG